MLKAQQNRWRKLPESLKSSVERIITCLKEEKKLLDAQIQEFVKEQEVWQEQTAILSSAPGVGKVTTVTLLTEPPEARLNRAQILRGQG